MQRFRAFTLIEIALSIFILMLLLMLAVPSLTGVVASNRLKQSLDGFNNLVRQAHERSVIERRSSLNIAETLITGSVGGKVSGRVDLLAIRKL